MLINYYLEADLGICSGGILEVCSEPAEHMFL
jgi:hypothetical protein